MQRHLERHHHPQDNESTPPQAASTDQKKATEKGQIIDLITGQDYDGSSRSLKASAAQPRAINCPWPNAFEFRKPSDKQHSFPLTETQAKCAFKFSRAYDLRRHLHSAHGMDVNADEVSAWVLERKRANSSSISN